MGQLSDLTGMDEASLTALLEAYGLVDGDGQLKISEALENLNSFLDQAAATGVTLLAEGARETVPYESLRKLTLSGFDTVGGYFSGTTFALSGSSYMIGLSAGETISMDVTYDPGMLVKEGQAHPQTVEIGFTSGNWGGDRDFKEGGGHFFG